MDIQMIYSIIYVFLILILIVCSILAKLSKKVIGKYTIMFDLCIVITIIANILIILAPNRTIVIYSYYLYYIGMTLVIFELADHCTMSLGVVEAAINENPDTTCMRVDNALYQSKANGKNKVTF